MKHIIDQLLPSLISIKLLFQFAYSQEVLEENQYQGNLQQKVTELNAKYQKIKNEKLETYKTVRLFLSQLK